MVLFLYSFFNTTSKSKVQKPLAQKESIRPKSQSNVTSNNIRSSYPSKGNETVLRSKSNDILDNNNNNRLVQLNDYSTKELLSYYRHKVEMLTEDHETFQRRLDKIHDAIGNQEALSLELNQRDAEISELQRALSDMQVYLFQEREHVLRLYAENDRLKIRELDDRKKIQHLLQLSNLGPSEVTYFVKQPFTKSQDEQQNTLNNVADENAIDGEDNHQQHNQKSSWISAIAVKPIIPTAPSHDQTKSNHATSTEPAPISSKSDSVSRTEHEAVLRELEMSKSSLRALQTQLEEQTRNAREQIDSLMEDRKAMQEEADSLRKRNEEKARVSSEQLKRCQELLYDSTKEFLAQRNQFRQAEKVWIAEKDKLLSQIGTKKFNSTGVSASTVCKSFQH
ncbi:unnamed protein product [Trichobilharzia regenti]|nr:unnamed protein product [Trichobilharzia regenti]